MKSPNLESMIKKLHKDVDNASKLETEISEISTKFMNKINELLPNISGNIHTHLLEFTQNSMEEIQNELIVQKAEISKKDADNELEAVFYETDANTIYQFLNDDYKDGIQQLETSIYLKNNSINIYSGVSTVTECKLDNVLEWQGVDKYSLEHFDINVEEFLEKLKSNKDIIDIFKKAVSDNNLEDFISACQHNILKDSVGKHLKSKPLDIKGKQQQRL